MSSMEHQCIFQLVYGRGRGVLFAAADDAYSTGLAFVHFTRERWNKLFHSLESFSDRHSEYRK